MSNYLANLNVRTPRPTQKVLLHKAQIQKGLIQAARVLPLKGSLVGLSKKEPAPYYAGLAIRI